MNKPLLIRDLLKKLNKSFETIMSRELSGIGITLPQVLVLRQIYQEPKTIGQISQGVALSNSTVSGIVDRLERDQLVERIRSDQDRRVVWIKRTEKVNEIRKVILAFQEDYFTQLFQGLTEEEMDQMIRVLQMLTLQLEKKVEEKP